MIIRVKHKNIEGALRSAREIAGNREVRLVSRRNNSGRFAAGGQNFTFEIKEKVSPPAAEPTVGGDGGVTGKGTPPKEIRTLREFFREYDDADEFDRYDIDGGVDYGEQE